MMYPLVKKDHFKDRNPQSNEMSSISADSRADVEWDVIFGGLLRVN